MVLRGRRLPTLEDFTGRVAKMSEPLPDDAAALKHLADYHTNRSGPLEEVREAAKSALLFMFLAAKHADRWGYV